MLDESLTWLNMMDFDIHHYSVSLRDGVAETCIGCSVWVDKPETPIR